MTGTVCMPKRPADGWLCVTSGLVAYGCAGMYCIIASGHTIYGALLLVTACASGTAHYVGWQGIWGIIDRALAWPMFAWYVNLLCRSTSSTQVHVLETLVLVPCTYGAALVADHLGSARWYGLLHTLWHVACGVMIVRVVSAQM